MSTGNDSKEILINALRKSHTTWDTKDWDYKTSLTYSEKLSQCNVPYKKKLSLFWVPCKRLGNGLLNRKSGKRINNISIRAWFKKKNR